MNKKIVGCSLLMLLLIALMACAGPTPPALDNSPSPHISSSGRTDDRAVDLSCALPAALSQPWDSLYAVRQTPAEEGENEDALPFLES